MILETCPPVFVYLKIAVYFFVRIPYYARIPKDNEFAKDCLDKAKILSPESSYVNHKLGLYMLAVVRRFHKINFESS